MARSLEVGRFVPTGLAMSIKRLRRHPSQATFPPPSLKFRTLGSPQYGFKPRHLIGQPCPAQKKRRLKRQVRIPRQPPGLTQPSWPWFRPAYYAGRYYQPPRPPALRATTSCPRDLRSARVLLSLASSLLHPDPPILESRADFTGSLLIQRVFARRPDLG